MVDIIIVLVFLFLIVLASVVGMKIGMMRKDKYWQSEIPLQRKDAIERSRAVLSGQFSEQLSPYLPNFNYRPTECKFLGKPVDFIVFDGLDEGKLNEIVFVEVKSGNSKLTQKEKSVKEVIENKKLRWEEYRVPEELTGKKEYKQSE